MEKWTNGNMDTWTRDWRHGRMETWTHGGTDMETLTWRHGNIILGNSYVYDKKSNG